MINSLKPFLPQIIFSKLNRIILLAMGALFSFILAHSLGFSNTYWASIPIWVIASDSTEELLLKGVYRISGTVIGSILAVAIISLFSSLFFKIICLTFFIAFFTTISKTQKAMYGYSNFLTAITIAIVSLPALLENNSWPIMSSRISCTMIGVLVSIFVLFFSSKRTYIHQSHIPSFPNKKTIANFQSWQFQKTFITLYLIVLSAFLLIAYGERQGIKTDSELAAFGIIVFAIVLGVNESPSKQSFFVLRGALTGAFSALAYRFLIHPHIDSSLYLYLSLLPFFLVGAFFKLSSLEFKGAIDANLCFLLVAKPGDFTLEFFSYLGHLKFLLLGAIAIVLIYQVPFVLKNLKIELDR